MQAAKRIAKNTGILYLRMGITMFISLYSTRLILVALGAKDFGLFNVVGGLIAMLGFLNASMAEATQRYMSIAQGKGSDTELSQIFNVSILLHFLIALTLFIILEAAGYIFLNYVLVISPNRLYAAKVIYQFMVVSTLFTVISVPYEAVINAHENMFLFAVLGIAESAFKLLIALLITRTMQDKLILYGILMAALSVVLLIIRVIYCQKKYTECAIRLKSQYNRTLMTEMSSFAGWSFLGYSTSMVALYAQGIVINIFFGTVVNAAQGIANQISGQLGSFAHTLMRALNPTIAKSEGAGDRELMLKTALIGSKISFFLLMLVYVPILIEMPYILQLWLKNVPTYTIIFCQLLLIRNLIEQLFLTLVTAISAVGKIRKFQIFGSALSFFPLLITYILFSLGYPPYSLYIAFIAYSVLASANILYFSHKTFHLSVPLFMKDVVLRCFVCFCISMCICLIPHTIMHESFIRLSSVLAISLLSFLLLVWYMGFSNSEQDSLKQITNSTFHLLAVKIKRLRKFDSI